MIFLFRRQLVITGGGEHFQMGRQQHKTLKDIKNQRNDTIQRMSIISILFNPFQSLHQSLQTLPKNKR